MKIQGLVQLKGVLNKQAWECALLTGIRDEIKAGNLTVKGSKRFGYFDNFFMPYSQWEKERTAFFKRSSLPENPNESKNSYAKIEDGKWNLSIDPTEVLSTEEENSLNKLKSWLKKYMRTIKLPQLLIEVDNDLNYTKHFMLPQQQPNHNRQGEEVCAILVSIMAHGCFIGPYTMARLTQGISYDKIRRITDCNSLKKHNGWPLHSL